MSLDGSWLSRLDENVEFTPGVAFNVKTFESSASGVCGSIRSIRVWIVVGNMREFNKPLASLKFIPSGFI